MSKHQNQIPPFQIPAPDKDANTVLDVQKIGYILHGRTIRPAAVGVSRK